jgi:CRP-like cAMP-binding protein
MRPHEYATGPHGRRSPCADSLFAGLTDDERSEIAACMRDVTVEAGTTLASEGDNAYELFVIEAGDADVHKGGEVVRKLGPGDVFGEIGLLATGTRVCHRDVSDARGRDVLARVQAARGPHARAREVAARDYGAARLRDLILSAPTGDTGSAPLR